MISKYTNNILFFLAIFFTVFSIHISPFTGVLSPRNIVIAFYLAYFLKNNGFNSTYFNRFWILSSALLFGYIIIITILFESFASTHSAFNSYFNYCVMIVFLPYFFSNTSISIEKFAKLVILTTLIQSIIVCLSFLFPLFRIFLLKIQQFDDNFLITRIVGLGIAGAKGSVYLFCGFMMNVYTIVFFENSIKNFLSLLVIFVSIALVGRTGFYMCLASVPLMLILMFSSRKDILKIIINGIKILIAVACTIAIIAFVYKYIDIDLESFNYTFRRLSELWTTQRTFEVLGEMNIPALTPQTFFYGEGWEKGFTMDGIRIWHDSGYVQRYFSLGLLPAVLSYLFLFVFSFDMICTLNKSKQTFWKFMLLTLFIIEYKEPFIYALSMPFVIIVSLMLENKKGFYEKNCISK